jgi:hypothetical protein
MTVSDILDGGVNVIKAAPRAVLVISATFVIPLELVSAWLNRDSLADRGFAGAISAATNSGGRDGDITGLTVLAFVLSGLVLALVTGAVAHLLSAWYADRPASARDGLTAALRVAPALLFGWFLVHLIEAGGTILLVVPGLLVMPLLMVTSPAIVIERLGPRKGVQRSIHLTRSRYGAVFGASVLIGAIDAILTVALGGIGLALSFLPYGWIADVVCQAATSLVTVPFVAGATTLVYLDLRIRHEGLDLELDIAEHFASAG